MDTNKIFNKSNDINIARAVYQSMQQPNGFVNDTARKVFNSWQKRSKGYSFVATASPSSIAKIDLSGTAKMFLGFRFINALANDRFTLNINEELIIEDGVAQLYETVTNNNSEYFEYLRYLTGKDTIKITYQGAAAQTALVQLYYI